MEKEKVVKCVPLDLVRGLQDLARRLWDEKNPAAVHVSALVEEFGDEVSSMEKVLGEYEAGYAGRLAIAEREHAEKVSVLESQIKDLKERAAASDAERASLHKKITELSDQLRRKEAELADARASGAESESDLNSRYVARMQELYEKLNKKEQEMLSSWEAKSRELELRAQAQEKSRAEKARALDSREKIMEDEFAIKKSELIKTFERARAELQARERALAEREAALRGGEKN